MCFVVFITHLDSINSLKRPYCPLLFYIPLVIFFPNSPNSPSLFLSLYIYNILSFAQVNQNGPFVLCCHNNINRTNTEAINLNYKNCVITHNINCNGNITT